MADAMATRFQKARSLILKVLNQVSRWYTPNTNRGASSKGPIVNNIYVSFAGWVEQKIVIRILGNVGDNALALRRGRFRVAHQHRNQKMTSVGQIDDSGVVRTSADASGL